jgi:hypothetical protein
MPYKVQEENGTPSKAFIDQLVTFIYSDDGDVATGTSDGLPSISMVSYFSDHDTWKLFSLILWLYERTGQLMDYWLYSLC